MAKGELIRTRCRSCHELIASCSSLESGAIAGRNCLPHVQRIGVETPRYEVVRNPGQFRNAVRVKVGIYLCICQLRDGGEPMQRTAKIFMNNRNQAVRLPKEFQFNTTEVYIRKEGDNVVLSPRPADWSGFLASEKAASSEFMEGIEDLPVQEREI